MSTKRAKTKKANLTSPRTPSRLLTIGLKLVLASALIVAGLCLVIWLGSNAGESVAERDRYSLRFADVQCNAPPGRDRLSFLAEVGRLAGIKDTIQVVEADFSSKLAAAFRLHPWVEQVDDVQVMPNRSVHIQIRFRTPVLAVRVLQQTDLVIVDSKAIMLPPGANSDKLPQLLTPVPAPKAQPGSKWDDSLVMRAVELVEMHKDRQVKYVERLDKGWRLTPHQGRALIVGW